jgi:hypothetical protein
METVNNIELGDESIYPDENVLKTVLEDSFESYIELLQIFEEKDMEHTWRYYKDGKAWLCKVQKKKRTIVWMSAWRGFMEATIYIPEKYIDQIYELDIGKEMKDKFRLTKNVGRSKPCIFEVRDESIFPDLKQVINFKIMNK